jgi:phosphoribosylaminoimidazole-succinocarboxamide synthase
LAAVSETRQATIEQQIASTANGSLLATDVLKKADSCRWWQESMYDYPSELQWYFLI